MLINSRMKNYNFFIFFISCIFILLIIYLLIIKYRKEHIDFFQNKELDEKYKKLMNLRNEENEELKKQYAELLKVNPQELNAKFNTLNKELNAQFNSDAEIRKNDPKELEKQYAEFIKGGQKELKNFYTDSIKKFYEQDKKDRIEREKKIENEEKQKGNIYNLKQYKQLMLDNDKKKMFKKTLKGVDILVDDCFSKCNAQDCIKLDQKKRLIEDCFKCNKQKNKCFRKSIIRGNCDDCNGVDMKDKIDCSAINNFGSPNPENLDDLIGVSPYYFMLNDNSPVSPFNKKCVFSWQTGDEI